MAVTKMQISPVFVNGFENGFHQWIQRLFLVVVEAKKIDFRKFFLKLDPLCGPVAAKPLVLELLCLEVSTSVASALTAETGFEIMKCMSDVDMPACARMGSKSQILRFFNSGYAHDRNAAIFRRRASTVTGNTLILPIYGGMRQSRDSLHRDRHTLKEKKVAAAPCSETAGAKKLKNFRETCFWHTTMPLNLVQID